MKNTTKVRIAVVAVLAIESAIFYLLQLNLFLSIGVLLTTLVGMTKFLVPKASRRDLDAKLDSLRGRMPEILAALSAVEESELHRGPLTLGRRIKEIGLNYGPKGNDTFSDDELEELHKTIKTRFGEAGRTRGEELPDEIINYITLHFFKLGSNFGKSFLESNIGYEVAKYEDEGLRPTYCYALDLSSGNITACQVRLLSNLDKAKSKEPSENRILREAIDDIDRSIRCIEDAESKAVQCKSKVAAWSLDESSQHLLAFAMKMKFKADHERFISERILALDALENPSRMETAKVLKNIVADTGVDSDVWFFAQSCIDAVLTEDSLLSLEKLKNVLPIMRSEIDRVYGSYKPYLSAGG